MLRIALATILLTTTAQAQYATPYPGPGPLYSNGTIQGGRDYNDWQQTRRDHGLDYDQSINRHDTYQPYPSVMPSIDDNRHHYSPYYNRDDD